MKSNGVRVAFVVLLSTATAQAEEIRSLEIDGGGSVSYVLAPKASALETSKLLHRHLSAGEIEAAALLSNAPKRRFEVFRDYRQAVGEEEFKKLFASYLTPETRLVAEVAIDRHRLLIWQQKPGNAQLAGQYFVEVDGRYVMDDVPNDTRTSLRWVLEAYRSGKLPRERGPAKSSD